MKKFKYLKAGIISALILALLCCASIALAGLFNKDKSDSIEKPEVSATSTAITTGSSALAAWNSAINSSGSTITFNLTQDWNFDTYKPSAGYLSIPSGKSLDFNGNGHTITGNNVAMSLFDITGGSTSINDLTIEGFTSAPIHTGSGNTSLNNVNIKNCRDTNHYWTARYGAICVEGGDVYFNSGTISNCFSDNGAAVYVNSNGCFNMYGGTITGCGGLSGYSGAAVYLDSNNRHNNTSLYMMDGEIINNEYEGVHIVNGEADLYGGTISGNGDDGVYQDGGVLYVDGVTISNNNNAGVRIGNSQATETYIGTSVITGNKGGGVINDNAFHIYIQGAPQIYGNTLNGQPYNVYNRQSYQLRFDSNIDDGANIYVHNVGRITYDYTLWFGTGNAGLKYFHTDNPTDTISLKDGEVYVSFSYATRWNALISNSVATNQVFTVDAGNWTANASTGFGSGVGFTSNGSIKVPANKNITIDLGQQDIIGAGTNRSCIVVDGGTLTIKGVNHTTDALWEGEVKSGTGTTGSGIYVKGGTLNMTSGAIAGNGGGQYGTVYVGENATFNMTGGNIKSNLCDGVYVEAGGTFTMSGSATISNNNANGVYLAGGSTSTYATFTMDDGAIEGNAQSGVYADDNAKFNLNDGTIGGGGAYANKSCGVSINYSTFNMNGGTIVGNKDSGVYVFNGTFTMYDGTIMANSTTGNGGGIRLSGARVNINGGDITNNTATGDGGGIYAESGSSVYMAGGTVSGNRATGNGGGVCLAASLKGSTGASFYVKGDPVVNDNYQGTTGNTLNNIYIGGERNYIRFNGALTSGANLYVNNMVNRIVTKDYAQYNVSGGTVPNPANYIHSDNDEALTFLIGDNGDEAGIYDNYASLWNALISDGTNTVVGGDYTATLTLNDTWGDWEADASGFGSGDGFTDDGSIKVPTGKTMTINIEGLNISSSRGMSALYIEGTLNLYGTDGEITNCGGNSPAAVQVYGTLNMYGGHIRENYCTGVYLHGTFNMDGGYIEDNSYGVEIDTGTYTFNMTGGYIKNNMYDGVTVSAFFNMKGGTISGNGEDGVDVNTSGVFKMENGTITGNTVNGIRSDASVYVTMTGGSITNNTGDGIALYNASLTMSGGAISGNTNGVSENHGSGHVTQTTITISDTAKITGNNQCGIVIDHERDTVNVEGGTISGNPIGVQIGNGTFTMSDGEIKGNTQIGVKLISAVTATLSGGTISGNNVGVEVACAFTMEGGTITDNTQHGVDMSNASTFYLNGGSIDDNGGHGVYVNEDNAVFTMDDGNISWNTGAAIYLEAGTVTINGGDISSDTTAIVMNDGISLNIHGGDIYYEGEAPQMSSVGVTFAEQSSDHVINMDGGEIHGFGKGVYIIVYEDYGNTFNLSGDGKIYGNTFNVHVEGGTFNMDGGEVTESGFGGGVYITKGGEFNLSEDGKIYGNVRGVDVFNGTFNMSGGEIYDNVSDCGVINRTNGVSNMTGGKIYGNAPQGVRVNGGTFTMSGSALIDENEGNGVYMYGGVFNMDGGAIGTVDGGNTSSTHGGGVYVSDGEFKMSAGEIVGNTATENGGGVYVTTLGKINITGGAIVSNNAMNGAGIYVNGNAANPVSISNARIQSNTAATSGGGLYVTNGTPTVTLTDVSVTENKANGGNGAGIYLNGCTATISGGATEILDNTASGNGGGIFVTGGRLNLNDATVSNNDATSGAGLYTQGSTAVIEIEDVSFTGNDATADGGAIYVASGTVTVVSATVGGATSSVANTAQHGGGLFVANGSVDFQSGSVTGNTASVTGGGVYLSNGSLAIGSVTVSGNNGGGIVVEGGSISMSGAPKIQNNFANQTEKSNLVLPEGKKITLTAPFATGAVVYVTGTKAITTDYTTHNSGTLPKVYFYSDDPSTFIVLKEGEAYFSGSIADLWNDAVERSTSESPVEFELTADWVAVNNSFGEGIGFQDGALYIPAGRSIILTSNGYKIEGCDSQGTTIYIEGKLVIKKGADITIKGTSEAEGAATSTQVIFAVNGGIFEMNAGYIVGYSTGVYVDGTFTMTGGEITGCTEAGSDRTGVFATGSDVTITGGQIYGNYDAIRFDGGSTKKLTISGGEIYGNTRGVIVSSGTAEIKEGAKIFENEAWGIRIQRTGELTISGGEIYDNGDRGVYALGSLKISGGRISGNSMGVDARGDSLIISGGSITGNRSGLEANGGEAEMTGGEVFANKEEGVIVSGEHFKFSGGKIYNNGGWGVWVANDGGEFTGGEIYGNVTGIYLDAPITVSGSLRVYDNFDKNGNPDNINVAEDGFVYVNGALTATAQLHVNFRGVVTTGFSNYNHGAAFDEIFLPDILGSDVTLNAGGEVVMTINYASMWNKAVAKSMEEQTQVKFTLYSDWISESNGNFGTTGDGFEGGALKVPFGANILFDLNNFGLILNNTTSGGNTTIFKVYGTLEVTDTSSRRGGGISRSGSKTGIQAVNVAEGGTFKLTYGNISAFSATYAVESHGNLYVAGGSINNSTNTGVYHSGDGKFEMTGGNIYGNNIGLHLDNATDATISGGSIYSNTEQGVLITNGTELTTDGGTIRNNKYGIELRSGSSLTMNGGNIYSNTTYGVWVKTGCEFTMNGGKIYNNTIESVCVDGGTFELIGGEIYGGNSSVTLSGGSFVMSGGEIHDSRYCVSVYDSGEFTLNGGSISNCAGSGVMLDEGCTFTMTGGVIHDCFRGVETIGSLFTMTGGEIYGCKDDGVLLGVGMDEDEYVMCMSGGEITSNGTGIGVDTDGVLKVSGAAKVYDNLNKNIYFYGGVEVITVIGTLTEAHIGVTVTSTTANFTSGYGLHNDGMAPATYFFSDDSSYSVVGVGSGTTQEAKLGAKVTQSAIIWRYTAKENGSVIESNVTIDGLYMGLDYEEGVVYTVEAINGSTGAAIPFIVNGETVSSLTVDGIGKYTLTVNNSTSQYTNTLCTFEILRVTLDWEYRIEGEGENQWKTVDFDSFEYTGRTYQFRAMLDGVKVQEFIGDDVAACDAGVYTYTTDETKYVNYELTITILTRKVEVVWNYNNAQLGKDGVYYWTYDGFNHAPVASLKNIGGDLAGVISLNLSYSNGTAEGSYAPIYAGDYTVTVNISDSYDGNIEISNTEATFRIRKLGLGVQWRDEEGTVADGFTFDYDGKAHLLTPVLDGLLAGEISPVTVIYKQDDTVVEAPVNSGTYTAYAQIEGESNYVLREEYSCQIVIEAGEIEVIFKGNEEAGGVYEWTFNGRGRTPAISVISKATGGEIANFTVEYASADNTGTATGGYAKATPVNAGMYVARVTVSDTEGNVLVQSSKAFEIKQFEVTVNWSGVGGEEVDGVIRFEYDGKGHTVNPSVSVNIVDEYGHAVTSLEVVCTNNTALTDAGTATATVTLKDTAYNKNFKIISGSSQKYEVYKKVITSYGWTDSFGGIYGADGEPNYSHGTITGAQGPNLTVTVEGATAEFSYVYSATFDGAWAADVVNGYTVTATLTDEYAKNYEFENGAVSVELTFYITATAGNKVNVNVTWVIFTDGDNYVLFEEYIKNNSITYNGEVQYPTPIYLNNGTYEVLSVNLDTVGADAGDYTATLMPSNLYNYVSGFERSYTIAPLGIEVSWQHSAGDDSQIFAYTYNGKAQAPYAYATVEGEVIVATVSGNVNANNYVAVADFGKNYTVTNTDEAEKEYEIKQLEISADDVVWSFEKADGNDEEGVYFTYDGAAHAPEASVSYVDGNGNTVTVKMAVTGATEAAGTHTAYAVFDGGNAEHNNFVLVGTATTEFRIVSTESVEVIWDFGNAKGNEQEGWYWIYDGEAHGPKAFIRLADGSKGNELEVSEAQTEAGVYEAYVTSDLDFGGTLPRHGYEIKAKTLDVTWSNLSVQYDGTPHKPAVAVEDGVDGALEPGEDYVVTEFTDAGTHTAEIKFLNTNYTFADGKGSVEFVIRKITLNAEVEWGVPADSGATLGEDGKYSWQYDGEEHAPVIVKITYTLGDEEVEFGTPTYVGLNSAIGTYTVTAALGTATWNGQDISSNFALADEIRSVEYSITHYVITLVWEAADKNGEDDGIPYWNFDGTPHGPDATYVDWSGEKTSIPYYKETNVNANAYTATVSVPANCVLAEGSSLTAKYFIRQTKVSVVWEWTDAEGEKDGVPYWTYDGKEHGPKAYIKTEEGKGEPLTVHGLSVNAGEFTAYVDANNANYVIIDGTDTRTYTVNKMEVFVKWSGNAADGGKFVWTYTEGTAYAPTAQLIDKDGNVIVGEDKKPLEVKVTGAMIEAGEYKATAVDGFANYVIVEDEEHSAQQSFTILPASLKDKNFRWDGGDAKVNKLTYTYTYNGQHQAPVVRVTGGISVKTEITDAEGNDVKSIVNAGTYTIKATSLDKNYAVPEDLATVTVVIAKAKVEVKWSDETLVYNGGEQAPTAYYVTVQGMEAGLSVTVDREHKNADKDYVATAAFTSDEGNYELDAKTITKKYDIEKKDISVSWTWGSEWTDNATDYDGSVHMPVATVATDDVAYDELKDISVYYTLTKDGKLLEGKNLKAQNAGKYVITYCFEGASSGNYMMSEGEKTFTINKVTLTLTLEDDTVDYGDTVPAYGYEFTGFVNGETVTSLGLDVTSVLNKWLRCEYNESTRPGTYDITVDDVYLASYLVNYDVDWTGATLTVNAPNGKLIWEWDGANSAQDVIYNGLNRIPAAYYKDGGTTRQLEVNVYSKEAYDNDDLSSPITEVKDAGNYVAVATYTGGVYGFTEDELVQPFEIKPLKITVTIHNQSAIYGEIASDHGAYLAENVGWNYDGTTPVEGDELEIRLSIKDATLTGDLVNAGEYAVTGSCTENKNYEVTFVGSDGESGKFTVNKAEIKVSGGVADVNETVQLVKGSVEGKVADLYNNPLKYVTFTGDLPEYQIVFSQAYESGTETALEDEEWDPRIRPHVYNTGTYVINYRITAGDNHEVKSGKWIVEAVYEDDVITVKFVKPYEMTYGDIIPTDLAKALIDSGCIEVTPSASFFLENVVATVVNADGEPVSGKLSAGRYAITFSAKARAFSQIVVEGDAENFGIIVNKASLEIEWGELEFDYDETTHTPEISVVIGGEKVQLNLGSNTVNYGGEDLTILVAVDGGEEIKEAGAYSILVTVLGNNFEIAEKDAHRAVTVRSAITPPVAETPDPTVVENKSGVPDWLLWVIIAALVVAFILIFILIVVVKRRPAGDTDGFYEDADLEDGNK